MQLGDFEFSHYEIMNYTHQLFEANFKESIQLKKNDYSSDGMGWFILEYLYKPRGYKIVFEHDRLFFSVRIIDTDGAHTSLPRMVQNEKISTALERNNIEKAIEILRKELEKDEICFYISKDDKQYKKVDGKLVRIKYPFMK